MTSSLIIPMAGVGQRFINDGYKIYKPFLKLNNKETMVENIVSNFPRSIKKYFIVNRLIKKQNLNLLKKIPNSKIIKIEEHKFGPGETILKASKYLQELENIFVSYCDITWKWNINKIKKNLNCIYCYKGWHPFTKKNNNYAFCKVKNNKLIEIREKSSFTKNWQDEPLSIGLFQYKNSEIMFHSLNFLKKNNIKTNDEYFPSEGFNFIANTKIKFVNQFVHIGKPRYLEEFKNWYFFFNNNYRFKKNIKKYSLADEYLIPAAGKSQRFKKQNIKIAKFLYIIQSEKKRCINFINEFLPSKKKKIIIFKNLYRKLINRHKFRIITLNKRTLGQAFTISKALSKIKENSSIFINSCDVFSIFDIKKFLKLKKKADIILFLSTHSFQDLSDNEYTWVEYKNNEFINIFIKKKPKNKSLKILTGNFYFKNKDIFFKCFKRSKKNFNNNELYIDDLIYSASKLNFDIKILFDEHYVNLGTPDLIKDYNFWNKYFN